MAILLDNDFHLYREADSDAELFSSSVGDAQVNKVMSLLCSTDFSHYQLQHAITQISQFLKFQQMRNVKSNMQAPLLCRKKMGKIFNHTLSEYCVNFYPGLPD